MWPTARPTCPVLTSLDLGLTEGLQRTAPPPASQPPPASSPPGNQPLGALASGASWGAREVQQELPR